MGNKIKAAIIDLDGIVTRTAAQHAKAWKKMFDAYNLRRKEKNKQPYSDFSIKEDYPKYIDGIPRYDGVKEFLKSRDIELPYGKSEDEPEKETICGLGNWKNEIFQEVIEDEGVDVFEDNVAQIREWKNEGIKTAVISSSKNCKLILKKTGLEDIFMVRVDGVVSSERNIKGKPAPDIFLEAAKDLDISPEDALVAEDAQAGVQAGKKGKFRLVIGVLNNSEREQLLSKGADKVVHSLQEVDLRIKPLQQPKELSSAMEDFAEIKKIILNHKPLFFLDFDGTLAPIVEDHENATMSDEMQELVQQLAEKYDVAVISGRGLNDVRKRVKLEKIYYAGSHGFEIDGPNNYSSEHPEAKKTIPAFEEIEPKLRQKLKNLEGVSFERKKFTLAIHYRKVKDEDEDKVHNAVEKVLKNYQELKKGEGKKVIEIRPNLYWDKGKAVEMLKLKLSDQKNPFIFYIGDDVTDEDVFKYLQNGIGILVGEHGTKTYADYRLQSVEKVKDFFKKIIDI